MTATTKPGYIERFRVVGVVHFSMIRFAVETRVFLYESPFQVDVSVRPGVSFASRLGGELGPFRAFFSHVFPMAGSAISLPWSIALFATMGAKVKAFPFSLSHGCYGS